MSAQIISFPPRGPFAVEVEYCGSAYVVKCRDHSWLHASRDEANSEAIAIASAYGVNARTAAAP
jgi:hypothetical protein